MEWEAIWVMVGGAVTMGFCLSLHTVLMFVVLRWQIWFRRTWPLTGGILLLMPSVLLATLVMVLSSAIQIMLWGGMLWGFGTFGDIHDAFYFAATTYTTLGAGGNSLPRPFRVVEPLAAMNGMLAAGLNTAILFAIVSSLGRRRSGFEEFFA